MPDFYQKISSVRLVAMGSMDREPGLQAVSESGGGALALRGDLGLAAGEGAMAPSQLSAAVETMVFGAPRVFLVGEAGGSGAETGWGISATASSVALVEPASLFLEATGLRDAELRAAVVFGGLAERLLGEEAALVDFTRTSPRRDAMPLNVLATEGLLANRANEAGATSGSGFRAVTGKAADCSTAGTSAVAGGADGMPEDSSRLASSKATDEASKGTMLFTMLAFCCWIWVSLSSRERLRSWAAARSFSRPATRLRSA